MALAFTSPEAVEESLKQAVSLQITARSQHVVNLSFNLLSLNIVTVDNVH